MTIVVTLMAIAGMVLVYAAVKGEDPRELIRRAIGAD